MLDLTHFQNKLRFDPPMRINSFVFDSKGQNVVAAGQDGTIRVFDINNCKLMARWKAHDPGVAGICLGRDDSTIFSVGHDSQVRFKYSILLTVCNRSNFGT